MGNIKEMTLPSQADGLALCIMYAEASKPRGILQCCHGMMEYKGRYEAFVRYMAEHGYHCFIHDMRGHGYSVRQEEDRGFFCGGDRENCITDLFTINTWLHTHYPDLPVFLFGHSMGSLEVRVYCKKYDDTIAGLLVCGSPSPIAATPLGDLLVRIMKVWKGERYRSPLLHKMALGAYNEPFVGEGDSPNNWVSANRENVKAYDRDPLCGFTFTLDGFSVLMRMMRETYQHRGWEMKQPTLPVLFLSGAEDPCRGGDKGFAKAQSYMTAAGYLNLTAKIYPGLRHELLREKNEDALHVMEDILHWLDTCS